MGKRLSDFNLQDTYSKLYQSSGVFRCYFRATNFVSLKHYPDFELIDTAASYGNLVEKLYSCIESKDFSKTILIIDFPGEMSIELAGHLRVHKDFQPVLTFNGVLHEHGLVGNKRYISSLLKYGEAEIIKKPHGYVFVLDYERFGDYSNDDFKKNFNNQYEITEDDLPPFEMLKDLGYTTIVYCYSNEIKEDIGTYLEYLKDSGLEVEMLVI